MKVQVIFPARRSYSPIHIIAVSITIYNLQSHSCFNPAIKILKPWQQDQINHLKVLGTFQKTTQWWQGKSSRRRVDGTITRLGCSFSVVGQWWSFCFWSKGHLCRSPYLALKFSLKTQVYCWPHFTFCVVKGHSRQDEHSSVNSRKVRRASFAWVNSLPTALQFCRFHTTATLHQHSS